ncbi:zinc ribbon domain-containing protein [Nocardia sp. NPDC060249]|uniref:zinc ribbon domain-containing protein n=1 Tax=Nocardia sp. NPDC060249 TaxID=3347082 RepID=UPI0036553663
MSNRARSQLERARPIRSGGIYLLRGRIYCSACGRKMQAEVLRGAVYYRCRARSSAPGSATQHEHSRTVNLRESHPFEPLDGWLATLFDRKNLDTTVAVFVDAPNDDGIDTRRQRQRIGHAQMKIGRHLAAIEVGVDPQAVVEVLNSAQAEKAAAEVELNNLPKIERLTDIELRKLIESLADVRAILAAGAPDHKIERYNAFELHVRFARLEHHATVSASLCGDSTGIRRAIRPLRTPTNPADVWW